MAATSFNGNALSTPISSSFKSQINNMFPGERIKYNENTRIVDPSPHAPIFECKMAFRGFLFIGQGTTKKGAQEEWAKNVLENKVEPITANFIFREEKKREAPFNSGPESQILPSLFEKSLIFVDLDNVPEICDYPGIIRSNVVHGFTSTQSSAYAKRKQHEDAGIIFHFTESAVRNAADVLLVHKASIILYNEVRAGNTQPRAVVLSRDSFGAAFCEILKDQGYINIVRKTSPKDLLQKFPHK